MRHGERGLGSRCKRQERSPPPGDRNQVFFPQLDPQSALSAEAGIVGGSVRGEALDGAPDPSVEPHVVLPHRWLVLLLSGPGGSGPACVYASGGPACAQFCTSWPGVGSPWRDRRAMRCAGGATAGGARRPAWALRVAAGRVRAPSGGLWRPMGSRVRVPERPVHRPERPERRCAGFVNRRGTRDQSAGPRSELGDVPITCVPREGIPLAVGMFSLRVGANRPALARNPRPTRRMSPDLRANRADHEQMPLEDGSKCPARSDKCPAAA